MSHCLLYSLLPFLFHCLTVSLCLSECVDVWVGGRSVFSMFFTFSIPVWLYISLCLSLSFSVCLCRSLFVSVCLCPSLFVSVPVLLRLNVLTAGVISTVASSTIITDGFEEEVYKKAENSNVRLRYNLLLPGSSAR